MSFIVVYKLFVNFSSGYIRATPACRGGNASEPDYNIRNCFGFSALDGSNFVRQIGCPLQQDGSCGRECHHPDRSSEPVESLGSGHLLRLLTSRTIRAVARPGSNAGGSKGGCEAAIPAAIAPAGINVSANARLFHCREPTAASSWVVSDNRTVGTIPTVSGALVARQTETIA